MKLRCIFRKLLSIFTFGKRRSGTFVKGLDEVLDHPEYTSKGMFETEKVKHTQVHRKAKIVKKEDK